MSTEAVKKFWQKAQADKALQAKLAAIEEKERQATIAAIIKLAADAGFAFTAAEYDAAVKEELARQHAAGELDEAELQQVAGGLLGKQSQNVGACSGMPGCASVEPREKPRT